MTVAHVIHDEVEAQDTTCYFDYNTDADKDNMVSLSRTGGYFKDIRDDLAHILLCSHDLDLTDKLRQREDRYRTLQRKVMDKLECDEDSDDDDESECQSDNNLTVIISHPHGCSKMISVGELIGKEMKEEDENMARYVYTTHSCPGSSGAPVFILAKRLWYDEHPHSGSMRQSGLSRSALTYD